jgi:hypothetical protein
MKPMKLINAVLLLLFLCNCVAFPEIPIDSDPTNNQNDQEITSEATAGESSAQDVSVTTETGSVSSPAESSAEAVTAEETLVDPTALVLNEIYYDASSGDTDGELFVELYAALGGSLSGYSIYFVNGTDGQVTETIDLPESAEVGDEDFYVIADGRTGALETTQVESFDFIDNFDPQNGPDSVQLLNRAGELIDSVTYGDGAISLSEDGLALGEGTAAADPDGGYSISRYPAGFDTDDNATDFVVNEVPSPGLEDVVEPEIIY